MLSDCDYNFCVYLVVLKAQGNGNCGYYLSLCPLWFSVSPDAYMKHVVAFESDAYVKGSSSAEKGPCSSISKCNEAVHSRQPFSVKEDVSTERTFVRTDPSYLKTLGQAHSGWIFGAIAELVDNSRDARASRSVEMLCLQDLHACLIFCFHLCLPNEELIE